MSSRRRAGRGRRRGKGLAILVVLAILTLLAGCGYKNNLVAPQDVLPRAVNDLRYELDEKGVTLFWSYPVETVSGDDLSGIDTFFVYQAVVPAASYCETCPLPFGPPVEVPGGVLPNDGKKTASHKTSLLRPGNLYFFKVISKAGWWAQSADSNIVRFLWDTPVVAPEGLESVPGDSQVTVIWKPVNQYIDESFIDAGIEYQVYRSLDGKQYSKVGNPVTEVRFIDTGLNNDQEYFYQVQALAVYEYGRVGGGISTAVSARPIDTTPPQVPSNIQGVNTGTSIKVFWDRVSGLDVQGYRVYRRLDGQEEALLVGEVLRPYNLFIDKDTINAARVYYSVSSFDYRDPVNESARSAECMVRN